MMGRLYKQRVNAAHNAGYEDGLAGRPARSRHKDPRYQAVYARGYEEGKRASAAILTASPAVAAFHEQLLAGMFERNRNAA